LVESHRIDTQSTRQKSHSAEMQRADAVTDGAVGTLGVEVNAAASRKPPSAPAM